MQIKENHNDLLAEYAVKFHGMKKGSTVQVKGWGLGKVIDYNFKTTFPYVDVHVDSRGFNSQYAADNVTMVRDL